MRRSSRWLGPGSYLVLLAWALFLIAMLSDRPLALLLAVLLAFGLLDGGQGLASLTKIRFWILILSIVGISSCILGETDLAWGWLTLSHEGFEIGLRMALRAVCLSLAFSVSVGRLSASEMARLFESARLRGLGFSLGVALNLLPVLTETIQTAYHTLRLRGGFRRPWLALRLFLVTVISNALRYGDDVVKAASARGFDPTMPRGAAVIFRRADGAFALGLLGLGGLLLFGPL